MAQIAVGTGRLGLVSGLKDFDNFIDQTDPQRDAYVTLKPIQEVPAANWSLDNGTTYVANFSFGFKGITRDIVGVKSLIDPGGLTRVETLALCRSTAGTFFFDLNEEFSGAIGSWDDGSSVWQIATWAFDGSSYLRRGADLTGNVDSKKGTLSFWFKSTVAAATAQGLLTNTGNKVAIQILNSGVLRVFLRNAAATNILQLHSTTLVNGDGLWHHVVASWDLAAGIGELYLDGVDDQDLGAQVLVDDTIDYTQTDWVIGASVAGTTIFTGEMGQLHFDPTVNVDITDANVLANYIKASNSKPTDLEQDGSGPTGSIPILFLHSNIDNILENFGTGGDFVTETGDVTVGLTTPVNPTGAMLWDQFTKLYVHQTDGTDPGDSTVVAVFGFYFANKGTWQPSLGDDKLSNGGFEANTFDDSTDPTDWTKTKNTGAPSLVLGNTDTKEGDQYPVLSFTGTQTMTLHQTGLSMVDGEMYRISGWYFASNATASIGIKEGSNWISELGRDTIGSETFHVLDDTGGVWKRFIWDIRANADFATPELHLRGNASGTGTVRFDGIKHQRIWRFNFYEPRLTAASLPPVETSSSDIFFGGKSIGSGSISIINSDGLLEELIAELEWMNQEALIDVGGTFIDPADVTQEVDSGDQFRQMTGLVQKITVTDDMASFDLQDQRIFFHQILPPRIYDDEVLTGMNLRLQGKPRPLWFGVKDNITPNRIDTSGDDYGVYELADTLLSPNGIKQISKVYAYIDSDAAATKNSDSDKRLQLASGTDYTEDLANGQFTIDRDVGPYLIDITNQLMDVDEGAAEKTITLTAGLYTANDLATEVTTQLNAIGGGDADWTVTYSDSTHKFTIAKAAGTGNLLAKTGTNKDISAYILLGFGKSADFSVGGGSSTGATATFADADKDHILRVNGIGYKDDGSGTFTGTPSASIEIGADILRALLVQWLKKPSSIVDETSFQFARDRAPESLSMYLNSTFNTRDLFDRLEFSNIANIIIDGSGKVFIKVYVGTVPTGIKLLDNADFQSFNSGRANNEIFTTIKVQFDQDPTTGDFEVRESTDPSVSIRLGRPETKEIPTFLKIGDNALSVSARMLELASRAARKIEGSALGSKMLRLEVGDKFQITRRRALAKGGQIRDEVFRVISIGKSALTGITTFTATDDRITVASQACITTCQAFCEATCQLTCQQSCQETCEVDCQQACETSCQEACQLGCQETCQLGCQTTCEVNCQETCQLACQGGCEGGGCQTNCENTCQTSCETSCQDACQSVCQTVCQTTECQGTCQVSCQDTCETSCQETCQESCQQTCELNCQSLCETSCQAECQQECQTRIELNPP